MRRTFQSPWTWALLAALLVLGWQSLTVQANFAGNWTGLFRTGAEMRVPPRLAAATWRNLNPTGYDGQFYRYLAHDPFLRRDTADYIDGPVLRARRILVPLAAWALACGDESRVDAAYVAVIALWIFAGVWWTSRLSLFHGRSAAWGLAFLAIPAAPVAMDSMTVDVALAALTVCFVWQFRSGESRWLWWTLAAAALVRDIGMALLVAAVAAAVWQKQFKRAAYYASAVLPVAAWYAYLQFTLPVAQTLGHRAIPKWVWPGHQLGALARFFRAPSYPGLGEPLATLVSQLDRLGLAGIIVAFVLAAFWLKRERPVAVAIALALFAALVPMMNHVGFWTTVYGYSRPMSPLLVLLLAAGLAHPGCGRLALALACSLAVDVRVAAEMFSQLQGVWRRWFHSGIN